MPIYIDPAEVVTEPVVTPGGLGSPDLYAYGDAGPCPRVEITVLESGTHTISVWRVADGQRLRVRGATNVQFTAAFFVVDYEVPLGRPVSYSYSLDGEPEGPPSLALIPSTVAWLQDPLSPSQSVAVATQKRTGNTGTRMVGRTALSQFTYSMPSEVLSVLGSAYPVALGGTRQAPSSIPFDLFCESVEACNKVRSIMTTAFPVLLRPLPSMAPMPPVSFLSVAEVTERPIVNSGGAVLVRWSLTSDLVAGPSVNIAVPLWSYEQVSALWETYGVVADTGRTYLDMLRRPDL